MMPLKTSSNPTIPTRSWLYLSAVTNRKPAENRKAQLAKMGFGTEPS